MHPAFSVIFLTTLIGAGQGLFLALYALDVLARHGYLDTPLPASLVVSACIWSRPVKSANFLGSSARMRASRSESTVIASSHEIGSNSAAPRSLPALRRSGWVSRAGEYCFMIPDDPLAQITPLLSGWSGLPSI